MNLPLSTITEIGLATGGLSALLRKIAPDSFKAVPPIGCNACLAGWTALALTIATWLAAGAPVKPGVLGLVSTAFVMGEIWLAATGIGGFLLASILPPPMDFSLPGAANDDAPAGPASAGRGQKGASP